MADAYTISDEFGGLPDAALRGGVQVSLHDPVHLGGSEHLQIIDIEPRCNTGVGVHSRQVVLLAAPFLAAGSYAQ